MMHADSVSGLQAKLCESLKFTLFEGVLESVQGSVYGRERFQSDIRGPLRTLLQKCRTDIQW